jgi:hypothetical protein
MIFLSELRPQKVNSAGSIDGKVVIVHLVELHLIQILYENLILLENCFCG